MHEWSMMRFVSLSMMRSWPRVGYTPFTMTVMHVVSLNELVLKLNSSGSPMVAMLTKCTSYSSHIGMMFGDDIFGVTSVVVFV